ncbi:alginate export family protein [Oleiharenicola lentus]|uniref:alginate export family protein n=1 Tax=Oleiharenicola lentus TaxID=2508720 RepID=UPI003F66C62A
MNSFTRATALAALLLSAAPAFSQYVPPPPARPFPGVLNEKIRTRDVYLSAWDIGVNVRVRHEAKDDAGFTDAGSNWDFSQRPQDDNNNHYELLRLLPRVGYTAKKWAFLVEGRSSYSYGDERFNATTAGQGLPERDGALDAHQAYVFVGNHKEFPVSLKLGRQELVYGDQRLVGHLRWNNGARTFDATKVRWQNAIFGVDVWTGGLVYNDHRNLNRSNSQDRFSGAYFNFPTLAKNEIVEAYLLARNVARGIATDNWSGVAAPFRFPGAQDLYTAGLRVKSKPLAYNAWDYGVEVMHQFGSRTAVFPATTVAAALAAPRLDQDAFAAVLQAGYTWTEHAWQPRLALLYSYASGDKNSADAKSGTFQNLFATTHLHYGYMDLNSLQNLHDLRLAYTAKPKANISLAAELHFQFLDRPTDFWYNVAGVPRNFAGAAVGSGGGYRINPTYSRTLGTEIDLVAGWTFTTYAQLEVGMSHYFRGDYIKQSLAAVGSKDASYCYVQLTLNL